MSLQTIDIKGKAYVTVDTRVEEFHKRYKNGTITTELLSDPQDNRIVMRATVWPDAEFTNRSFTGYAQELIGDGYINKTSALENCETSAVGRALGFLGIGLVGSIATADEIQKAKGMESNKELNRPTQLEKDEIVQLRNQLKIKPPTADDSRVWTQYCMERIQAPYPQNREQAQQLITIMNEELLKGLSDE